MSISETESVELGQLCDLVTVQVDPAGMPEAVYVGLEHIPSGRLLYTNTGFGADVQSLKYSFRRGDVLYGKLRPYLDKAIFADTGGICTTELLVLRAKQGVDPKFLACVVHDSAFVEHAMSGITGAHHPRTSWGHISQFALPAFILEEQTAIARLLWCIHDLLTTCEKLIETAQQLKSAAMGKLFTRGLRGEPQKESEIGPVPDSWEVTSFAAVREWLQYGTSARCSAESGTYPVLRIPNVESGRVNPTNLKYCDLPDAEAEKYRLVNGDLLFIRTNGVLDRLGSCAVYADQPEHALFASYLIRARMKSGVDPRFVAFFLASDRGTELVAGRATPAADGKYNLNTGTIDSLPLPVPSDLDEQRAIVAILDGIDRKIDLHRRKRAVLEELFKVLLHKLVTGDIRVSDLDLSALDRTAQAAAESSSITK